MSTPRTTPPEHVHEVVRRRYAEIARDGRVTPAPGGCGPQPAEIAAQIGYSATDTAAVPEGANLGVGCGAPLGIAALQAGETVLDLGSGAGFDALLAARAVGPTGHVIGVDMTDEMLAKAGANAEQVGAGTVEFRKGFIEALPVEDASSEVVLDAPLPDVIAADVAALTGCVAGAALRDQYLAPIAAAGLAGIQVVNDKGFGVVALSMVPDSMLCEARAAGIDVERVADTVRSLTIVARKPNVG